MVGVPTTHSMRNATRLRRASRRSETSDQAAFDGGDGGACAVADAELREHVRDVVFHGALRKAEHVRDFGVVADYHTRLIKEF